MKLASTVTSALGLVLAGLVPSNTRPGTPDAPQQLSSIFASACGCEYTVYEFEIIKIVIEVFWVPSPLTVSPHKIKLKRHHGVAPGYPYVQGLLNHTSPNNASGVSPAGSSSANPIGKYAGQGEQQPAPQSYGSNNYIFWAGPSPPANVVSMVSSTTVNVPGGVQPQQTTTPLPMGYDFQLSSSSSPSPAGYSFQSSSPSSPAGYSFQLSASPSPVVDDYRVSTTASPAGYSFQLADGGSSSPAGYSYQLTSSPSPVVDDYRISATSSPVGYSFQLADGASSSPAGYSFQLADGTSSLPGGYSFQFSDPSTPAGYNYQLTSSPSPVDEYRMSATSLPAEYSFQLDGASSSPAGYSFQLSDPSTPVGYSYQLSNSPSPSPVASTYQHPHAPPSLAVTSPPLVMDLVQPSNAVESSSSTVPISASAAPVGASSSPVTSSPAIAISSTTSVSSPASAPASTSSSSNPASAAAPSAPAPPMANYNEEIDLIQVGNSPQGLVYSVEVDIGGTAYELVLDTGSSDTWIANQSFQCTKPGTGDFLPESACKFGELWQGSPSFAPIPDLNFLVQYTDGETLEGAFGDDTVQVAGITVPNQMIALVNEAAWNGDGVTSGLLGLAFPGATKAFTGADPSVDSPTSQEIYNPVFTNMWQRQGIAPLFSLALDRHTGGHIAFGGLPEGVAYTGSFTSTPLQFLTTSSSNIQGTSSTNTYTLYTITVSGFSYSGSTSAQWSFENFPSPFDAPTAPGAVQLIVDSGQTLIYLPAGTAAAVNALFNPPPFYQDNAGRYIVQCTAIAPEFGVDIAGQTLFVNGTDMVVNLGGGTCVSAVAATGQGGTSVLGDPFLKNVIAVFDVGAQQMRFAARTNY